MAKKKKKLKKKSKKLGFKFLLFIFIMIVLAVIFTPSTMILLVGMLPTMVAYIVDNSLEKNKTFTIGAMNFAGCFPFLLGLWTGENSINASFGYLEKPTTIMIIYSIAALGYLINWFVVIGISNILIEKSKARIQAIEDEKNELIERWGQKVDGRHQLDQDGFTIDPDEEEFVS